ncbi:MAG: hypothetical protein HYZ13_07385 [Acidobacteria bacterium]|nr:hypothetical protein [Acidobacteriota bacterium]
MRVRFTIRGRLQGPGCHAFIQNKTHSLPPAGKLRAGLEGLLPLPKRHPLP